MSAPRSITVPCLLYSKSAGSEDYAWFGSEDCPGRDVCDDLRARFLRGSWTPPAGQERVRAVFVGGPAGRAWVVLVSQERDVLPAGGGRSFHRTRMALLSPRALADVGGLGPVLDALERIPPSELPRVPPLRVRCAPCDGPKRAARETFEAAIRAGGAWDLPPSDRETALRVLAEIYRAQTTWNPNDAPALLDAGCRASPDAYRIQLLPRAAGLAPRAAPDVHGAADTEPDGQVRVFVSPTRLRRPSRGSSAELSLARPPRPWSWRRLAPALAVLLACLGGWAWTRLRTRRDARITPRVESLGGSPRAPSRGAPPRRVEGGDGRWHDTGDVKREGPHAERRRAPDAPHVEGCVSSRPCAPLGY